MDYDPTLDALLRPHLADPLDPALFAQAEDALCAELSRLAYYSFKPGDAERLKAALAALGLTDLHLLEDRHSNTQAFVALDGGRTACVVFRGTESDAWRDLISDAMFLRRPWSGKAWVHRGFRRAYDNRSGSRTARNMRCLLIGLIAGLAPRRIVATGHSLGAALATLFASDHAAAELVTFGSPLVGNAAFAGLFSGRQVRRYRQCADFVTRIPYGLLGYHHVAPPRYIDRTGRCADPASIDADIAQARAEYRIRYRGITGNAPLRDGADHTPINYVTALLGIRPS